MLGLCVGHRAGVENGHLDGDEGVDGYHQVVGWEYQAVDGQHQAVDGQHRPVDQAASEFEDVHNVHQ